MKQAPHKMKSTAPDERAARCERILAQLRMGDISKIARRMGVTRIWVSYVLHGKGVSEPVLRTAEALLAKRKVGLLFEETAN